MNPHSFESYIYFHLNQKASVDEELLRMIIVMKKKNMAGHEDMHFPLFDIIDLL